MARRPWQCYRKHINRKPYIKKRGARGKDFVHGGADPQIRLFEMGNLSGDVDFDVKIGVQIMHTVMVSDNTLEAARRSVNRKLQLIGRKNFKYKVRPHPYRVYRENKMMAFAGADRLQSGMRGSFGKPMGRCAKVRAGQIVLECSTYLRFVPKVKAAFKTACYKFPAHCRIVLLESKEEKMEHKVGLPGPKDP